MPFYPRQTSSTTTATATPVSVNPVAPVASARQQGRQASDKVMLMGKVAIQPRPMVCYTAHELRSSRIGRGHIEKFGEGCNPRCGRGSSLGGGYRGWCFWRVGWVHSLGHERVRLVMSKSIVPRVVGECTARTTGEDYQILVFFFCIAMYVAQKVMLFEINHAASWAGMKAQFLLAHRY